MVENIKKKEAKQSEKRWTVKGIIRWDDGNDPVIGAIVHLYSSGLSERTPLGTGETDKAGRFIINLGDKIGIEQCHQPYVIFFVVTDPKGHILISTQETPSHFMGYSWEMNIQIPGDASQMVYDKPQIKRPKIQVGPLTMDAKLVSEATTDDVLNIARILANRPVSKTALKRIGELSPEIASKRLVRKTLSGTPILAAINALIKLKGWPRDVALEVDRILQGAGYGYTAQIYDSANFHVTYYDDGPDAVDPDTSAQDVYEPGSNPPVVIDTLPAGSPPTYVKRVCYWLEKALTTYVSAPFSMLNPAASGKIAVFITSDDFGSADPSAFYINKELPPDIICAVGVHELFHMVQFQYPGAYPPGGIWTEAVVEGGATIAEDSVADLMNRYLDEAAHNFNGIGVMSNPNQCLTYASYKASLFWRYIAEQQSADITEPFVGVETYRNIIEHCSAGTWSTDNIKDAIRELPWYQDFYEFGYLDPAKLDRTSSETVFGNYVLACYLKDLGVNVPDRRFDFIEDEEEIRLDDILQPVLGAAEPLQTTLASVTLTGTGNLTAAGSLSFNGQVNSFASRYYVVTIDPAVTNINVQFAATSSLTSSIFQIVLIDEDNAVRDIHRTDFTTYTKYLTNLRDGKHLNRILLVVSGANSSGNFSLSVSSTSPVPDVMVTRWHTALKTEYEIDSFNWAWTWVSPDIWVDNDQDGIADGEVYFNYNNKLHVRLHNKGNADASGIQIDLYYQSASAGLSSTAWLPVQDANSQPPTLTNLSLSAGATQDWVVDWAPLPDGTSHHFCVKAVVTVPGDPNTDNKRVLSNFGNVVVHYGGYTDLAILRQQFGPSPRPVFLHVVPRLTQELNISSRDLIEQKVQVLRPGEAILDKIRIEHRPLGAHVAYSDTKAKQTFHFPFIKRMDKYPDPHGYYGTDPRALPPGVADKPMITVVNEIEGRVLGGMTFLVTVEKEPKKAGVIAKSSA
jgi:hypothetical protein